MNYLQARQIKDGENKGRWHFTVRNDGRIWPTGYCADGCSGHDSEAQANDHFRDYEADNLHTDHFPKQPRDCEYPECKSTSTYALRPVGSFGGGTVLCRKHRNKKGWKACAGYGTAIQIMSS